MIAFVLVVFGPSAPARAQQFGDLSGFIDDQTGAMLVGVRVTVRGAETRDGETNTSGGFEFRRLPEGDYQVFAELRGFQPARRTIRVAAGERIVVSLTLQVALLEQTIVTAAKVGEVDAQSLPMAINAVSNTELERLGITTVDQGAALAPSVTFTRTRASVSSRSAGSVRTPSTPVPIRVPSCTSMGCTWLGPRWRSSSSWISIGSRSFADRRAPYMDATPWAAR
jgi:hypothetical protein